MNSGQPDPSGIRPGALEPVRAGLMHDGVAVIPGLVPADLCARARGAIDAWLGECGESAETLRRRGARGLVPLNQHPAFWEIRQRPEIYTVFRALLGSPFLWVTVDAGIHDPAHSSAGDGGDVFGWEIDPRRQERHLRGMICLDDCSDDIGAFRCVPHIFRNPEPWWSIYGIEPFDAQRIRDAQIHSVPAGVGSLILWDARLPSGRGANETAHGRYGMLLAMDLEGDDARRRERLRNFDEGRPPAWSRELPGQAIPGSFERPRLSDLGKRLLGSSAW